MKLPANIYNFNWVALLLTFSFLNIALLFITQTYIVTDSVYYTMLSDQLNADRIAAIINLQNKFRWVGYAIQPLFLLIKFSTIGGIIFTGLFLLDQQISFKSCLKIVILAEFVPFLAILVKVAYLLVFPPATLQDVQTFYPLALTQLINTKQLSPYLIYPLQQLNLFEVAYWVLIALGISTHSKKPFLQGLKVTACSYGIGLGIWLLCVMFIQLQFS